MPEYDVFLSYNSADQEAVELIARRLREEAGLEPFLDRWHLVPGEPWQEAIEEALDASRSCAVFLGPAGLGTWENEEMRAGLDIRASRPDYRVIPILLPGAHLPERGRLPRFLARLTWVDFRPGLDDARAFHELACGIQGVAPGPEGVVEAKAICPFRGLQVFDEEHARFFFGREALTQHLVEQLRGDRFLAVIGPSGSGKSSLARAGLVPQVRAGALPASERWSVVILKPGPHPLEALAARLLPYLDGGDDPLAARESLLGTLRRDERGLHGAVQVALAAAPDSQRLLIVADQFEELFTLCRDESARAGFIANLLYASAIAGGQTVAVVTMRADFFGKCAAYPELAARLAERDVLVGPMSEDELRRAMEGPAQAAGLHYEKGLVETILDDLGDEPGTLPLLQHTLLELWERRRGGWLTIDAYYEIGGVQGALARRADAVYARFTAAQQAAARRVLLRLTQPGEGTEDTRRRAVLMELLPTDAKAADVEAAVRELTDARLLTTGEDEQGREVVDVAHEALIRGWPRLQGWIDADRAALLTHRRLTEAAQEWERHGRDESYLSRGARLAEAAEWAKTHADDLNPMESAFLEASEEALATRRVRERRAARFRLAALGAIAVLIIGILVAIALGQSQLTQQQREAAWTAEALAAKEALARQTAEAESFRRATKEAEALAANAAEVQARQTAEARRVEADDARATAEAERNRALSRQLAAQSANQLSADNSTIALLLAIEAGCAADTSEALAVLRQAFAYSKYPSTILSGHALEVNGAMWNSDETLVLTAGSDGTARVWDVKTGDALLIIFGHSGNVQQAIWNQDETQILTAGTDGTARIWNAKTGDELLVLSGHAGWVTQAIWNSDENRILTAGEDGTARVWDAETGAELLTLSGHTDWVSQAVWNSDESRILTASWDETVRLWDAETGAELLMFSGHTGWVSQALWNSDESRVLTASWDGTARVWDANTGNALLTLSGHNGIVWWATWNTDGSRVLTAGAGGTARVWDAETGTGLLTLFGHTNGVNQAAWNADESRILTASRDGTARMWDAETGEVQLNLTGHFASVNQAVWNSDESRILTASDDRTARLWNLEVRYERPLLSGHTALISQAKWSADGDRILTASDDGTARVWSAETGIVLLNLKGHSARVNQAVWNSDESRILTASADGTARVWDTEAGNELVVLSGCPGEVLQAVWNSDESRILTATANDAVCVWDAETGRELLTVAGQVAAWDPGESRILTGSADGTVRVWDAKTGKDLLSLSGPGAWVTQVLWSTDGNRMVTASGNGAVKVWDASTGDALITLPAHTGPVWQTVWNRDESRILTAGNDGKVVVWDAKTGERLLVLSGHTSAVFQATWSRDESLVLTASNDHTARVWDAKTGEELFLLSGHTGSVYQAAWNADESYILTASSDGTVRQWYSRMADLVQAACQRAPRNMTREEWSHFMKHEAYRATCDHLPIEEAK